VNPESHNSSPGRDSERGAAKGSPKSEAKARGVEKTRPCEPDMTLDAAKSVVIELVKPPQPSKKDPFSNKQMERETLSLRRPRPLCMLALAVGSLLIVSQSADPSEPPWVFNYPSASLQIKVYGKSGFELNNVGRARIVEYRLGCAALKNGHPTILTRMEEKHVNIVPSDSESTVSTHGLQERAKCENLQGRLTVVFVKFEDGAEWVVPESGERPAAK
jgi:hypothetical protein